MKAVGKYVMEAILPRILYSLSLAGRIKIGAPLEELGLAIFVPVSLKIEGTLGKDAGYV